MNINLPFSSISFNELLTFTKHLAVLINSGIPITEALDIIQDEARSTTLRRILTKLKKSIDNGQTLAKSLAAHPQVFNHFYLSLIEIGETSGTLGENLTFLADYLSQDYQTRKKIQNSLLYPGLILTTTLVVGGFISFYILPQLIDFFESFETTLPLSTQLLLALAHGVKQYGSIFVIGVLTILGLFFTSLSLPLIKSFWQNITLRLPLIGPLINTYQLARFTRNLGTLLKSGIPIADALTTTANALTSLPHYHQLLKASKKVSAGKTLSEALETSTSHLIFPRLTTRMIAVGEKSGQLENNLLYLANFYEDEIDYTSKNLTTILEPILLIIISLLVAFVALAIISPIYELTGSIGNL